MKRLHPYAIILGVGVGIATLATLRHPLFALLLGVAATLGLDMAMKPRVETKGEDKDK
ncbi:MAG: hypothetical protein ABJ275_10990 [Maricaulaceae bacterium]